MDFISQHADNQKRNKSNKLVSLFFASVIIPPQPSLCAILAGVLLIFLYIFFNFAISSYIYTMIGL